VLLPAGVLLAFTAGFVVVAVARFHLDDPKLSWT
jgi:hypothetical protein